MAEGPDGFLGRWARRKNDALQGKPLAEPAADLRVETMAKPAPAAEPLKHVEPVEPVKAMTLDDVKDLTKDSDFKPFMNRSVEPGVRNAAMKKLFADPHFNVMDGLDIYIDDYSKPDPLPLSMLRQMASAKFLKLFDDEEEEAQKAKDAAINAELARETVKTLPDDSVALSEPAPQELAALPNTDTDTDTNPHPEALSPSGVRQEDHAHIDLRLQPDHAPESPDTGRGAA